MSTSRHPLSCHRTDDDNHLTQAYASFLTPAVAPALQRADAGEPVVLGVAAHPGH
jgi:hypothetical protein